MTLFAQRSSETYQHAKIYYNSYEDILNLGRLGIPVDHGIHKRNYFIISDFSVSELSRAREAGYTVEVLIEDAVAHFLRLNKAATPERRNATCNDNAIVYEVPDNFDLGSMGGYLTYQEILDELDAMRAQYPNLISAPSNISNFLTEGQPDNSVTPSIGNNPIKWVKITDNPDSDSSVENEPQVLYDAIHHAREPVSVMQLIFYMWYLLENYDTDVEVQNIVNNTELFFVPVVNPDGYLYNQVTNPNGGGLWRKNRKNGSGVDNNRNYNFYINGDPNNGVWGGPGSSSNQNSDIYHGPSPFSEIENQAMKWLVENNNFKIALNNHTFGELLYFPHAYADVPTPDEALFIDLTSELVSQNGYNNLRDNPFSGDSDDFMYGSVGTHDKILAMTPEIGPSFWPPSNQIVGLCQEMMYLNLTVAHMVNNYATIEDTTPSFIENLASNVNYTIKRLGIVDPANFTVSINPVSSNITSVGSGNNHNGLSYGQDINDAIAINLSPSINTGDIITYELIINNGAFNRTITVNKLFGLSTILLDEPANDTTTNWTTNDWQSTTESFVSASNSITDSPNANYSNNENSNITLSNAIDLSGALSANLSFYAKWDIENNFDYVQVEISANNGSTWVPQCGNFTNTGVPNQNGANNEPLYDGTQNDWVLETIDLSDYLNQTILIRFRLVSDGFVTEDGFFFDDLQVNVLQDNLSVENLNRDDFDIYPNPVENNLHIETQIDNYSISVHTILGQVLFSSKNNSGNRSLDYSSYAKGIYLMTIDSSEGSKTFKILKQ
nr:M14 family zinc carboxypeptidase [uncultured Psychroserpens sp.]